tara:strand:+ start:684 stop:1205 length:522 start_codon:yes stop_codon:yes gene_type:complete
MKCDLCKVEYEDDCLLNTLSDETCICDDCIDNQNRVEPDRDAIIKHISQWLCNASWGTISETIENLTENMSNDQLLSSCSEIHIRYKPTRKLLIELNRIKTEDIYEPVEEGTKGAEKQYDFKKKEFIWVKKYNETQKIVCTRCDGTGYVNELYVSRGCTVCWGKGYIYEPEKA